MEYDDNWPRAEDGQRAVQQRRTELIAAAERALGVKPNRWQAQPARKETVDQTVVDRVTVYSGESYSFGTQLRFVRDDRKAVIVTVEVFAKRLPGRGQVFVTEVCGVKVEDDIAADLGAIFAVINRLPPGDAP